MRHQNIRVGALVSVRGDAQARYGGVDLDGQALPLVSRVKRMFTHKGYQEPWIELEGVNGQFRAKELTCGACGSSRGPGRCPECQ
jgi:hypothetical protein